MEEEQKDDYGKKEPLVPRERVTLRGPQDEEEPVPFSTSQKGVITYDKTQDRYILDETFIGEMPSLEIVRETVRKLNEDKSLFPSHARPNYLLVFVIGVVSLLLLYVLLWGCAMALVFLLLNPIISLLIIVIFVYIYGHVPAFLRALVEARKVSRLRKFVETENTHYQNIKMEIVCSDQGNFLEVFFDVNEDLEIPEDSIPVNATSVIPEEEKA